MSKGANMGEWRDAISAALIAIGEIEGQDLTDGDLDSLLQEICEAHGSTMSVGQRDHALRLIRQAIAAHARYVGRTTASGDNLNGDD